MDKYSKIMQPELLVYNKNLSKEVVDLMKQILKVETTERLDMNEILNHQ